MTTKGKAAGVLDTPQAALETQRTPIFPPTAPDRKSYENTQAQFALKGFELRRAHIAGADRVTYVLRHWQQPRNFTHWHDVQAFLASLGGTAV